MKVVTVAEARDCLPEIIAEAYRGERIILRNGDQEVTLFAGTCVDPEIDSPELEAELLKDIDSPLTPYSAGEMRAMCEEIARKIAKE